jgi:hypothetical protein
MTVATTTAKSQAQPLRGNFRADTVRAYSPRGPRDFAITDIQLLYWPAT